MPAARKTFTEIGGGHFGILETDPTNEDPTTGNHSKEWREAMSKQLAFAKAELLQR